MLKLLNIGNNCYLNSALQVLFNCDEFKQSLEFCDTDNSLVKRLKYILIKYLADAHNIRILKRELSKYDNKLFGNNMQQDSHEALIKIIDTLHEINNNYSSMFRGKFTTTFECEKCKNTLSKQDDFFSVDINTSKNSVTECINEFIKPELIEDARCEKCNSMGLQKYTNISRMPRVLIICMKRFQYDNHGKLKKNNQCVSIDEHFSVEENGNIKHVYELTSMVSHYGSGINSGHYNVDVLRNSSWYNVDDNDIRKLKGAPKSSSDCYILVYTLVKIKLA